MFKIRVESVKEISHKVEPKDEIMDYKILEIRKLQDKI